MGTKRVTNSLLTRRAHKKFSNGFPKRLKGLGNYFLNGLS